MKKWHKIGLVVLFIAAVCIGAFVDQDSPQKVGNGRGLDNSTIVAAGRILGLF